MQQIVVEGPSAEHVLQEEAHAQDEEACLGHWIPRNQTEHLSGRRHRWLLVQQIYSVGFGTARSVEMNHQGAPRVGHVGRKETAAGTEHERITVLLMAQAGPSAIRAQDI